MLINDNTNLEKLLYRILLGYYYININNINYKVTVPDIRIRYESEILYDNIIEENKFDQRLLTLKDIEIYLMSNGIWNNEYQNKITKIENEIEDTKVDIYLNFYNVSKKNLLEKNLQSLKKILSQLNDKKNCLNHLTIEEYALFVKNEFIVANTIYDKDNNLVFTYNENLNYVIFQKFLQEIMSTMIDPKNIRKLAKSELWRSYSTCSNIERNILKVDDNYKLLITFHNMYNNIRQHQECPSEDIIDHDDALDGWCINQNRKAEKEKKKQSILDKTGGNKNKNKGDHVFIFTNNEEEIKAINDLNDYEQKLFKEEVAKYSEANPGTRWEDLPPVKRQLQMEAQKMTQENLRRK